jgi:aminoglycoside phosphotransferase (APT) family kinase protein
MAQVWDADHELTADQAAELIVRQFPGLEPVHIEMIGVGWDNVAFRVNERWVFRFPRRKLGTDLIVNESRILPLLAPALPLPIPAPRFFGRAEGDYPYDFAGYALIPGETACCRQWTDTERVETAADLARFLAALHSIPIPTGATWAPGDLLRRADLPYRAPKLKERLQSLQGLVDEVDAARLCDLVDRLVQTPPHGGPPCWQHGDLYPRHLLADDRGRLCGVIDWGDVHLGDPAGDLAIVYTFLPAVAHDRFWHTYGPADEATKNRARFRAIHYGAILTTYGREIGDAPIREVGEYALRAATDAAD